MGTLPLSIRSRGDTLMIRNFTFHVFSPFLVLIDVLTIN